MLLLYASWIKERLVEFYKRHWSLWARYFFGCFQSFFFFSLKAACTTHGSYVYLTYFRACARVCVCTFVFMFSCIIHQGVRRAFRSDEAVCECRYCFQNSNFALRRRDRRFAGINWYIF